MGPIELDGSAADGLPIGADRWNEVDDGVETRGLDVHFGESGDEVRIWTGDSPTPSASVGRTETVALTADMTTYRRTEWGVTFEVRMRGTGAAVGSRVDVGVRRAVDEARYAGEIEAENAQSASDWIEVEYARLSGDPEGR